MAFVNFTQENGQDFISIQHNANVITLDSSQFSQLMFHLHGLENILVKKSKQKRQKIAQVKKRMKRKWDQNHPQFHALAEGFSTHLVKEIKSFSASQCAGCLLGSEVELDHAYCRDKSQRITDFLQASMYKLDNDYFRNLICNEYNIVTYPSVDKLLSNNHFIEFVTVKLLCIM